MSTNDQGFNGSGGVRFTTTYPNTQTASQFVVKVAQNAGLTLTQAERDNLVALLTPDPTSVSARAAVLRSVAENGALQQNELRRAFVLMQYFGYLRRNPDAAPESSIFSSQC
ncbi:MAG: hypothetical protein ACJ754_07950 [Pyrinomonadaceae bacterium]